MFEFHYGALFSDACRYSRCAGYADQLRGFIVAFFSPVFFAVAGLGMDLRTLLDRELPAYQFREYHTLRVAAPPHAVWRAIASSPRAPSGTAAR